MAADTRAVFGWWIIQSRFRFPTSSRGNGLVNYMDEASQEAFKGVNGRISAISISIRDFRKDFGVHVDEDREMRDQVKEWTGQISVLKWFAGVTVSLVTALLGAVLAHVVRHW